MGRRFASIHTEWGETIEKRSFSGIHRFPYRSDWNFWKRRRNQIGPSHGARGRTRARRARCRAGHRARVQLRWRTRLCTSSSPSPRPTTRSCPRTVGPCAPARWGARVCGRGCRGGCAGTADRCPGGARGRVRGLAPGAGVDARCCCVAQASSRPSMASAA